MVDKPNRKGRPWVNVAVITTKPYTDRYLVGWHKRRGWVFPGGRVHPFERLADAARREFTEETGATVAFLRKLDKTFETIDEGMDHHSITVVYVGVIRNRQPRAGDELQRVEYHTYQELMDDEHTAPLTISILFNLMRGGSPLPN